MGGSKRKKWIDLVEMASIGKPYISATAIDFEAIFRPFFAFRRHLWHLNGVWIGAKNGGERPKIGVGGG